MDRIQAFRLFVRVVDLGSFSKAADDLGIGQPSATKQVARMEKQLGARLLHRSTHGVTPTEVGVLYYEKCKLILHHVEEAEHAATLFQSEVLGGLRISTSVAFGRLVLASLVMQFMKLNPKLRVELMVDDHIVNLVEQGVDVAIRLGPLADSTLGSRYLGVNPWVTVASPGYLKRCGTPADPAQLSAHDALIYTTVQGDARWHFTGPDHQDAVVPVKGFLRSNSLLTLLDAAKAGMGIAILPWYVANEAVKNGLVQPLLTKWSPPAQQIHAVYPSPNLVPAKVRRFVDWLQRQFGRAWWTNVE
jgi:DNA-binding transcriptional LysR family regulator